MTKENDTSENDGEVLTRKITKNKKPAMFEVLLLNDDYTSMEFVVMILQEIFRKSNSEATEIMLAVHESGMGVAGIYVKEIAESKVETVHRLARLNEFPLKCSMREI